MMLSRGKLVHRQRSEDLSSRRAQSVLRGRSSSGKPQHYDPRGSSSWGNALTMALIVVTSLLMLLLVPSIWKLTESSLDSGGDIEYYHRTLSFEVCNGMSNQRLSMLYGIIMAVELGRIPVLPGILLSGVQWSNKATGDEAGTVPMDVLYDVPHFLKGLDKLGIQVMLPQDAPPSSAYTAVDISGMADPSEELATWRSTKHLKIGCPLFKLPGYYFIGTNARIMWATLNGLRPNKKLAGTVNTIVNKMRSRSPDRRFNFLHLRIEDDWILHCKRWEHIRDGHVRNNCYNNSDTIDEVLQSLNIRNTDPIYIASFWEQVEPQLLETVMRRMKEAGYTMFTSKDFKLHLSRDREVNALIDYEISLEAFKMIGNSVSTFTTLCIFQRRHLGRWSSYYNGGNIPLADFLPMDNLPWVFTYSSDMHDWDYMVKAAVMSATRHHTLKPFCIFLGNTSAPIVQWMVDHGVTLLFHKPSWSSALWNRVQPGAKPEYIYKDEDSMQTAFVRMDIPIIPELEQYIYILYSGPDVFFHKKVTVSSFPLPWPKVFGLVRDTSVEPGVDGGVMLVNLPAARQSYEKFKEYVLSYPGGPHFPKSAGLVGAYLEFYHDTIQTDLIPESFAAKPLEPSDNSVSIVHFQGPKPHEYWEYFKTQHCRRVGDAKCQLGFEQGLCFYVKKWKTFLNKSESLVGEQLWHACTGMFEPYLKDICTNRAVSNVLIPSPPPPPPVARPKDYSVGADVEGGGDDDGDQGARDDEEEGDDEGGQSEDEEAGDDEEGGDGEKSKTHHSKKHKSHHSKKHESHYSKRKKHDDEEVEEEEEAEEDS